MGEISVRVYHDRASQLSNAMELCHDDMRAYSAAVGLLAVHSAISYNDAVLISLTGKKSHARDHKQAAAVTIKACRTAKIQPVGLRHLDTLIGAKADVSCGNERVDNQRVEFLYQSARRFRAWAESILGGRR